ncbi:MAG TPA: SAM-dependent chlorinase/fluorinase [Vicinamibacterales bacterium]|nr:SAM-dependent chlorinase/fluorinase [Vicinamibacterales bacterium]
MRPVLAFLTDFGTSDHYVGAMKGVALGICPDATLVDVTHGVPPQDVLAGAFDLAASYRYFPAGTIFVVVVDPGVGSARRGIAAEAGGYRFVAPDNGVLSVVFDETPPSLVVELTEARFRLPTVSRTFEGRDRFAPAGAWLATGVDVASLGPRVDRWEVLARPAARIDGRTVRGEVMRVDRFGNLITNIDHGTIERLGEGTAIRVALGGATDIPFVTTYAAAAPGGCCALVGSSGRLEVAVNGGNAAERLSAGRGTAVLVRAC